MQTSSLNSTKNIAAIVWDLDGTLYPADSDLSEAINNKLFEKITQKLECSQAEALKQYEAVYNQLHSNTRTLNHFGINGEAFFISVWQELDLPKYIGPNPKLALLFKSHSLPQKQIIFTNTNTQETVANKLAAIGIDPASFDAIYTSIEAGHHKPDPDAFIYVCEQLQLPAEKLVYVGDRERVDIEGAKNVGMKTILVHPDITEEIESAADAVVMGAEEVFALFRTSR